MPELRRLARCGAHPTVAAIRGRRGAHPTVAAIRARRHRLPVVTSALLLAVLALVALAPAPAQAQDIEVTGRVTFEAGQDGILELDGDRRYRGRLELVADREVIVNQLAIEDYVAGVAEMPSRWPSAALRAQAVAARTYAWYVAATGVYDDYDICATTACQVYRGGRGRARRRACPPRGAGRWTPPPARCCSTTGSRSWRGYFSTSGGRTYGNEEAFPSDGPRPYLVSIDDPFDAVSPYHRWTVRFTRDEFDEVLSRGATLAATVPVATVERVGAVDDPRAVLRVTGRDGTVVDVGAVEFADLRLAGRPGALPGPLPRTASRWTSSAAVDGPLQPLRSRGHRQRGGARRVVVGGHGVGLGQYGARGRAAGR